MGIDKSDPLKTLNFGARFCADWDQDELVMSVLDRYGWFNPKTVKKKKTQKIKINREQ